MSGWPHLQKHAQTPAVCARYRRCRIKLQDSKLHHKGDALLSILTSAEMSVPPATSIKILTHVNFKTRTSKQNTLSSFQHPFRTLGQLFFMCLEYIYLSLTSHFLHCLHHSPWTQILFHFDSFLLLL